MTSEKIIDARVDGIAATAGACLCEQAFPRLMSSRSQSSEHASSGWRMKELEEGERASDSFIHSFFWTRTVARPDRESSGDREERERVTGNLEIQRRSSLCALDATRWHSCEMHERERATQESNRRWTRGNTWRCHTAALACACCFCGGLASGSDSSPRRLRSLSNTHHYVCHNEEFVLP